MKNKERLFSSIFILVSVFLVVGTVLFIVNFRMLRKNSATKVGAVFIGASDDKGWNESHYKGIGSACVTHSCIFMYKTNIPEEEEPLNNAVTELVDQGCSIVFLTSYGYGAFTDSIARKYPDVAFYSISGDFSEKNCVSYFARIYQVRYLSGMVAGSMTESGILGYVTAMAIPETVRSINAYALGACRVNPDARVVVKYTGGWDDREKEEGAAKELIAEGADVMTFHEDRPYAIDLADEMGIYTTGYDYVSKDYSDKFLTAAVFEWNILYRKVLGDFLSGRANFSNDYWLGLDEGCVSLYHCSVLVPERAKRLVKQEQERIKTWRDVFSGEIYDNTGVLRCHADEGIGDDELFNSIDWYVEGVVIHE